MATTTAAVPSVSYGPDGVYRLRRLAAPIPSDPTLSMTDLLFRRADACPSALALVNAATGRSLTFASLRSAVRATAVALAARAGVRPGDSILLLAPNCLLYPVCFFTATALGAIATTVNPLYTPREVAKQANDAKVRLVITVAELLPTVAPLNLPVILLDDAPVPPSTTSTHLASAYIPSIAPVRHLPQHAIRATPRHTTSDLV